MTCAALRCHTPQTLNLATIVKCRALSGCCVATSLVGFLNSPGVIPLGGTWGRHCSNPAWCEAWRSSFILFYRKVQTLSLSPSKSLDSAHI